MSSVIPGIFFDPPRTLPRGRHALDPEVVRDAQRERLLTAVTELMAARGYRGFKVGDVATRAGVSLGAFYDCFESRDDCVFQGYGRFIEVLLSRMVSADLEASDRDAFAADLIDAYLGTLSLDLVTARAYHLEIDALGAPARAKRRGALMLFAERIRQKLAESSPDGKPPEEIPWVAYIGLVYAARHLVSDVLDEEEPDLQTLSKGLRAWTTDVFRRRD